MQGFLTQSLETDYFNIEAVRIKKGFVVAFLVCIALLTTQFGKKEALRDIGLSIMLINPNIDTFIVKFGWSDSNASGYISILSMVNPLGGLVGTFVAKYMVDPSED